VNYKNFDKIKMLNGTYVRSNETVTIHCSLLRPTKFYWKNASNTNFNEIYILPLTELTKTDYVKFYIQVYLK